MENYKCIDERFADIQMLRYRLDGFDELSLRQKKLVFYLSQATLWGRDITFDQHGRYNLKIRKLFETIYTYYKGDRTSSDFLAFEIYLKRLWFSNGIHHHYGCEKFVPDFSPEFLEKAVKDVPDDCLFLMTLRNVAEAENKDFTAEEALNELKPAIFDKSFMQKRVNMEDGIDVVENSACNFYVGLTQKEVENFYNSIIDEEDSEPVSYGLNTTLIKDASGIISEDVWKAEGLYGPAIKKIIYWLEKAEEISENKEQRAYIHSLIEYYKSGDLRIFNKYCIEWVAEHNADIDFVNGFIEVYGDPLGLKGSWEGIVEYKDNEATKRTKIISSNAQWFEDNSPVDGRFKKSVVHGVTANVVRAAMLGGDEYPSTAIGINLPNADWIRAKHGSKSVTISNLIGAYNEAAHGNGFKEEFINDKATIALIDKYGDICDDLHTDLHECLGHGSGRLLDGVSPDALKTYGSTIEEARADLFGLYYIADKKLLELGLLDNEEAYKASYYSYMLNGLMTQLVRIQPGNKIEEAHMRNRAIIARWCYAEGKKDNVVEMKRSSNGKTYLEIHDYAKLRTLFAKLLSEVQRIKSEGDYEAARILVEQYGVNIDSALHEEILQRYKQLNLAPYKGFINPVLRPVYDENNEIADVVTDYTESYSDQMLRYSRDYSALIR